MGRGASLEAAAIIQGKNYVVLGWIAGVREQEMETELVELTDFSDCWDIRGEGEMNGILGFWF